MIGKLAKLFIIKSRIEAYFIIYAMALGAAERGKVYLEVIPGRFGQVLFLACLLAVWMAGAKILDALSYERKEKLAKDVAAFA